MRMAGITGSDLSPHSPQTTADDPASVRDLDDTIRYASPPSRVGGIDDDEGDAGNRNYVVKLLLGRGSPLGREKSRMTGREDEEDEEIEERG